MCRLVFLIMLVLLALPESATADESEHYRGAWILNNRVDGGEIAVTILEKDDTTVRGEFTVTTKNDCGGSKDFTGVIGQGAVTIRTKFKSSCFFFRIPLTIVLRTGPSGAHAYMGEIDIFGWSGTFFLDKESASLRALFCLKETGAGRLV